LVSGRELLQRQHLTGFSASTCLENGFLPVNGNVIKKDLSFWEAYAKGTYTVNDQVGFSGSVSLLAVGAQFGRQGHLRDRRCEVHRTERRDA
jgi:hypothetical protein